MSRESDDLEALLEAELAAELGEEDAVSRCGRRCRLPSPVPASCSGGAQLLTPAPLCT